MSRPDSGTLLEEVRGSDLLGPECHGAITNG